MFCFKSVAVEEPPKRAACITPTQKDDSFPTHAVHGTMVKTKSSREQGQEKRPCVEGQHTGKDLLSQSQKTPHSLTN